MVAGILSICGAFSGRVDRMYENISVRDVLVKNYLRKIDMDPDGCYPILQRYPICFPEYWNEKISEEFIHQGLQDNQPWMYKDSRTALLWQLWTMSFPDSKWVVVRRKPEDIINSCKMTGYMRTFQDSSKLVQVGAQTIEEAWQWVVNEYVFRFTKISRLSKVCFEVWPEKMAVGDFTEIEMVVRKLGLEWKEKEVREFIQPKLYKHNKQEEI